MKCFFRLAGPLAALLVVSACTGSSMDASGLEPLGREQAASVNVATPAEGGASLPATPAASGPVTAIRTSAKVQFAPAVGAPTESVNPLAARLTARAAQRGIGLAAAGDATATHVMRGYFSAFTEQSETTVVYVWDVLDPGGNRLHRIQGQQKVPAGAQGSGWSSVTPQAMEAIADRTVDDLATWLASRAG